jgi:alkylhydroperoxidase family enzyme
MLGPRSIEPLHLFRTLAVHEALAASMLPMHLRILGAQAMVPPILREVMIHRTSALTGSEYEWGVHVIGFGKPAGLTDAQLESTVHGASTDECWDGAQASVFRLADEMHKTCRISDELWSLLSSHFDDHQILELVTMAGWYHVIAYVCNACELEPETWAARFPLESGQSG